MKNKSRIFVALLLFFSLHAYTQNTNPRWSIAGNTVAEAGIGNRLGTMTLGIPLNIYAGGTQRAIFNGTTGFLGVGTLTPAFQLDVQDNINVNTANAFGRGYWIDGFLVLQVPALENTFVGKGAGANFVGPLGENTFVGFQAGGSMVGAPNGGDRNTFVGRAAGYAMINGRWNTFIGTDAGLNMVSGNSNTFVGEHAGFRQVSGSNNTYVGSHSGQGAVNGTGNNNTFMGLNCGPSNVNGNSNTFNGVRAGNNCTTGDQNCFYGELSGAQTNGGNGNVAMGYRCHRFNHGGNNNTFVGIDAGTPALAIFWNLTNANGFGSNAIARASNTMILGDNTVNVGIGLSNDNVQNGPQNKLEIDAGLNGFNPSLPATVGASGLTFRDMHSGNTPLPANGVALSVNSSGEVILVPAGGGAITGANNGASQSTITPSLVVWGQDIAQAGNPGQLISNREIPMNGFNVFFIDPATSAANQNRMQVGNYTGTFPYPDFAKIAAINGENSPTPFRMGGFFTTTADFNPTSVPLIFNPFYFGNISATYKIGVVAIAQDNTSSVGRYVGVSAGAYSTISQNNVGVSGKAYGSTFFNSGVAGLAGGTDVGATYYGVSGGASGSGTNIGVYGFATGGTADYAAFFDGDVFINSGTFSSTGFVQGASDQNLKTNIDTISDALGIISQLAPKTFYFDTLNTHNLKLSGQKQYGLIAQQVETVLPELVSTATKPAEYDTMGNITYAAYTYKTLNYDAFIAILMKGMQEQQHEMDSMQNTIADMQSQINGCCSSNVRTQDPALNQTNVTLNNSESIVLNQNVPNPFAEQTTITYNLPESVKKAQLLFYDESGKLIKAVDLTGRGNGQVNVFANDLSNGIYSYALVADGQIADTKRMVKTN